jgi:PelA/Pel-15E family pectate lyase
MPTKARWIAAVTAGWLAAAVGLAAEGRRPAPRKDGKGQIRLLGQDPRWYATDEAVRIAEHVLAWQRSCGGWPKNQDMGRPASQKELAALRKDEARRDATLDNGATHTQMRYLASVYSACLGQKPDAARLAPLKEGFLRGVDYLLAAQYPNGGWPQFWPEPRGYHRYITFNDGAMIGAMSILRDVAAGKEPFAFVDEPRRRRAQAAVEKGIACILKCQIVANGRRTAWCAQHDPETLQPRPARSYELASISGAESVGVVQFLMAVDKPAPEIVASVQAAVAWFDRAKLTGIRLVTKKDPSLPKGYDRVVVRDAAAAPMWARFYQIATNKPIFCSRDGIPRDSLAEISPERRTGYSWLGYYAADLLAKQYPAWQRKWAPGQSVLGREGSR